MYILKWIYSFFITEDSLLPEKEMHGSYTKEMSSMYKKNKYDILDDDYITHSKN